MADTLGIDAAAASDHAVDFIALCERRNSARYDPS
jgi:hypothetical protein